MATLHPFGLFGAADPFRDLRRLQDEMERLVGAMAPGAGSLAAAGGFPAVNIYAGQDGIAVLAELPGVEKDDLEVQAHQDTLTLSGTRRPATEQESSYHRHERRSGSFSRSIQLPYRVDPDRIQANLENGVLRLSLPRPEEDKPRRIAIGG
ncbi:MAG: Hsp20/alpha crystallin family protein [Geminicoccaceae bacterium]